jgi:urease accessory protein
VSGAAATDATTENFRDAAGTGALEVVLQGRRSVVTRARATSPLRLLTPSNHGHAAWVFTSTFGGGLLGGDAVHLQIDVGNGAAALLQTQASTKVYRSPRGASSKLEARVGAGGQLLVMPDPVVCFAGAAFEQAQQVDVQAGGSLVLMDWITAGRRASGERWAFDRYASRLSVDYAGRAVLRDALLLSPAEGPLANRMGRFNCVCAIVIVGDAVQAQAAAASEAIAGMEATKCADLLVAAAPLGSYPGSNNAAGCVIRIAGVSTEDVGRAARTWLGFVPGLLGDDPWARKW